jgi:acetolactate synthase I/II/III large subunit
VGEQLNQPLHAGDVVAKVARTHGVETIFTLSGAHVFPVYDGAIKPEQGMRLLDVRHEQTAAFAAEATGKLTRRAGLAVVTAGPGVTNTVSALAQAQFSGAPMVVIGGRAPHNRWGMGSLQELDHPPLLHNIVKHAETLASSDQVGVGVSRAFQLANAAHRGPTFVDIPLDTFFAPAEPPSQQAGHRVSREITGDLEKIVAAFAQSERPVLVLGTDIWADQAEVAAREFVEHLGVPTITNGMGRGLLPRGHPYLLNKARRMAFGHSDLVVVIGAPLDFRLGYGVFGGKEGQPPARVIQIADSPEQVSKHVTLAASATGELAQVLAQLAALLTPQAGWVPWLNQLREDAKANAVADQQLLTNNAKPIHPARIYGELSTRLADDAVIIGDGGDFVSFAGKFVEPKQPGCWLDPGPFGCLGAGLGAAIGARIARPSAQVTLLMGDGAAGFSLADIDTLIRHQLPVVMVIGNNSAWGLEKGPMQLIYGYDVVADLAPQTRYDKVCQALGGAGEMVTQADHIGPALDRAYQSGVPYLVNIVTDTSAAYPRNTLGI